MSVPEITVTPTVADAGLPRSVTVYEGNPAIQDAANGLDFLQCGKNANSQISPRKNACVLLRNLTGKSLFEISLQSLVMRADKSSEPT